MNGKITVWKPSTGRGQISASEGTYSFDAQNSPGLAGDLSNTIIPPDAPVAVTFDLAGTGEAINIVLATRPVSIAAAAAPMQVRSIAPQASIPKKPAKKLAKKKRLRRRIKRQRRNRLTSRSRLESLGSN